MANRFYFLPIIIMAKTIFSKQNANIYTKRDTTAI